VGTKLSSGVAVFVSRPEAAGVADAMIQAEVTLRHRTRTPDGQSRDTIVWTLLSNEYHTSLAATAEIEAFDVIGRPLL
jgi:hypothetical protein